MSRSVAEIPPSEGREMSEANRGRRDNAVTDHHAVPQARASFGPIGGSPGLGFHGRSGVANSCLTNTPNVGVGV
jgi:hypothetical protein